MFLWPLLHNTAAALLLALSCDGFVAGVVVP
jgi:hypothetical protein